MRLSIIMAALLLISSSAVAVDKGSGKETPKAAETAEEKKNTSQKVTQEKKSPEWPRPYKSTEEISVDSIVPFPTDI